MVGLWYGFTNRFGCQLRAFSTNSHRNNCQMVRNKVHRVHRVHSRIRTAHIGVHKVHSRDHSSNIRSTIHKVHST